MKIIKLEERVLHESTEKQVDYISSLFSKYGYGRYNRQYIEDGRWHTLSKSEASKLIEVLIKNKDFIILNPNDVVKHTKTLDNPK
jgi:hypothetical protein